MATLEFHPSDESLLNSEWKQIKDEDGNGGNAWYVTINDVVWYHRQRDERADRIVIGRKGEEPMHEKGFYNNILAARQAIRSIANNIAFDAHTKKSGRRTKKQIEAKNKKVAEDIINGS